MTREFFRLEAAGGIVLVIAAAIALLVANSPLFPYYDYFLHAINFEVGFSTAQGGEFHLAKPLLLWINDGLMAVFFFLIGLEIKRELVEGELSSVRSALLPVLAAIGGMAVPALIYWFINMDSPETLRGWAIPSATDIAFALGVLALLGSRAPISLKIFLTAIAIIDDLGAILIIAFFYAAELHPYLLLFCVLPLAGLLILNRLGVVSTIPYLLLGAVLWIAVLKSGVHATIAGVLVALFIPLRTHRDPDFSPAKHLEHALHPWVVFAILPIFAFANAGVPFKGMGLDSFLHPVTLGIMLGLFVGKQIGIFGMAWLAVKSGLSPKPADASWLQIYAVSLLCGIGFTMSLFIGGLSFETLEMQASVRLGVLVGSLVSAVLAYILLRYAPQKTG